MTEGSMNPTDIAREIAALKDEIARVIVGQREVVDGVIAGLLAEGHILLEGAPGLGKTLLVKTLAECTSLQFARIQFTPDLMPSDVTGTTILVTDPEERRRGLSFTVQRGPIFDVDTTQPLDHERLLGWIDEVVG